MVQLLSGGVTRLLHSTSPCKTVVTSPCKTVVRGRRRVAMAVQPPPCVRGMTEWQPELFSTSVLLPCLRVKQESMATIRKPLEKFSLKMIALRPVQECPEEPTKRLVLLNPTLISMYSDLTKEPPVSSFLEQHSIVREDFLVRSFPLTVHNWTCQDLLKAVLPEGEEGVSGYSLIGHIIHLNLREPLLPYKSVIGQALLLTKGVRSVVNKSSTIANTYRNFAMELLAGEEDFQVSVKENGFSFEFDFSSVYWNPRLSSEHSRIVSRLGPTSLLFDACAGVGPFAVPAARSGARVYANDLNPESHKWLQVNCAKLKKSKVTGGVECYNEDARDFIKTTVKTQLTKLWTEDPEGITNVHITMNLPALAITFLDVFRGLFSDSKQLRDVATNLLPKVHVYGFSKAEDKAKHIQERCELYLGAKLDSDHLEGVSFVRNVAPNKDMMRASFLIPPGVVFDLEKVAPGEIVEEEEEEVGEVSKKRDRSPEISDSKPKKIVGAEAGVWYGERL